MGDGGRGRVAGLRQRTQGHAEGFERRKAGRLAGLAIRHRADLGPVHEHGRDGQAVGLRPRAAQPHTQPEDRQRHSAAAAELSALGPWREPAAPQHRLIFKVCRSETVAGSQAEALDPALAAALAHPLAEPAADIAAAIDVRRHLDRRVGFRCGCHSGRLRVRGWLRRNLPGVLSQPDHLQFRGVLLGIGVLIDRDEHLGRTAGHPDQRSAVLAAQPAIGVEAADADLAAKSGGRGRCGQPDAGQPGRRIGRHGARVVENTEQAGIQGHEMRGHLQLSNGLGDGSAGHRSLSRFWTGN